MTTVDRADDSRESHIVSATSPSPIEPPFGLRREDEGGVAVLVVEGEVDLATAPELTMELQSVPLESDVVVDLCETLFMGSTGLRVLFDAHAAFNRGIAIACKPAGPIGRLFDVTFAGQQLRIYESRAGALADISASASPQRDAFPVADPDLNE